MNVIAKISCYFERSVVTKEYLIVDGGLHILWSLR